MTIARQKPKRILKYHTFYVIYQNYKRELNKLRDKLGETIEEGQENEKTTAEETRKKGFLDNNGEKSTSRIQVC